MAMYKYGAASVVEASISTENWVDLAYKTACKDGSCRMKTARTVLAQYDPKRYLLSHCSIIAAVDVDEAKTSKSKYKDYLIKPEYSKYVNNNGDAWTKRLLEFCYRTFVGANNFLEHVQIPELSKGKVIDAVLREIPIGKDKLGNDLTTYYVDILVATDRKHDDLIRKIEAGETDKLSMGCQISYSICTKCGNKAVDETQACSHVRYEKNNTFYDENGVQRKVAELCGHASEPESVNFVDASWVRQPAFTGAVVRNVIEIPTDIQAKLEIAHDKPAYEQKIGDYLKAASHLVEAAPKEDEAPADEAPVDEAPADEAPMDEAPMEEEIEEFGEKDIKKWKKQFKNRVLEELSKEVIDDLTKKPEEGPRELETLDETLIKPASLVLKKVWGSKKSWDSFLKHTTGNLNKKDFNKLRYGTYIALTSNDPTVLADYGFNKRDFLAILSYLDNHLKNPMPLPIKKSIAKLGGIKGRGPVELLSHIVSDIGRKLTEKEASRALIWLKLVDYYKD